MSDDGADHAHPDGHDDLESERDFLLRSLDDLDAERAAGNIDADTYRVLHDDYTARVPRSSSRSPTGSSGGRPRDHAPRPRCGWSRSVASSCSRSSPRSCSRTRWVNGVPDSRSRATRSPAALRPPSPASVVAAAKAAAAAQPKSYDARISYARALLSANVYSAAVQEYIVAAKLDPTQAEPLAYTGWLTALFARNETNSVTKKALLDAAATSLDRAISVDPTYPDSYVFKGLLLTQIENKQCTGAVAFEQFLATAPDDHPMRPQVLTALALAVKAGTCPPPQSTPTTKP